MSVSKNLLEIILKQKAILSELEQEANSFLKSDTIAENEFLKKEVSQLKESLVQHSEKLKLFSSQNAELKNALYEQVYNEKIQIVNTALKKNDVYFK